MLDVTKMDRLATDIRVEYDGVANIVYGILDISKNNWTIVCGLLCIITFILWVAAIASGKNRTLVILTGITSLPVKLAIYSIFAVGAALILFGMTFRNTTAQDQIRHCGEAPGCILFAHIGVGRDDGNGGESVTSFIDGMKLENCSPSSSEQKYIKVTSKVVGFASYGGNSASSIAHCVYANTDDCPSRFTFPVDAVYPVKKCIAVYMGVTKGERNYIATLGE